MSVACCEDDVLEAFQTLWKLSAIGRVVPTISHNSPPAGQQPPYAVLTVKAGDEQPNSMMRLSHFDVTVDVRTLEGKQDRRAVGVALEAFHAVRKTMPLRRGRVLTMFRKAGDLKADDVRLGSRDVQVTTWNWDLLVQQPVGA